MATGIPHNLSYYVALLLALFVCLSSDADAQSGNRDRSDVSRPKQSIHSYHYFLLPTAQPVPKKLTYFSDTWIITPSIEKGLTDYFSARAGIVLIPSLNIEGGNEENPLSFLVVPHFGWKIGDKLFADLIGYCAFIRRRYTMLATYAEATRSDGRTSVTAGVGYGEINDYKGENDGSLLVTLDASVQAEDNFAWMIEMHSPLTNEDTGIGDTFVMYGVRIFGHSLALDIAAATTLESLHGGGIAPILTFGYAFDQ